jgi:hypothetical protein
MERRRRLGLVLPHLRAPRQLLSGEGGLDNPKPLRQETVSSKSAATAYLGVAAASNKANFGWPVWIERGETCVADGPRNTRYRAVASLTRTGL